MVMESITPYPSRIFGDLKNFLSGSPAGAFSKGKSVNLKEGLKDGEVYEMYAYHLKNFLPRLNGIYRKMIKSKVREIMLKYAEFMEINGEIRINLEPYSALKTLYLLCDVLEEAKKRGRYEMVRGDPSFFYLYLFPQDLGCP